jgi:hypothetical protein
MTLKVTPEPNNLRTAEHINRMSGGLDRLQRLAELLAELAEVADDVEVRFRRLDHTGSEH